MAVDISKFVDIHVHILPGIDDGPKDMEESVAMAEAYDGLGVSRLIATPHFIPGTAWSANIDRISRQLDELQSLLAEKGIGVTILPGMEIAHHQKLLERVEKGHLLPLGESSSYLLEPSFSGIHDDLFSCCREMLKGGHGVILAHPERISAFQKNADPLLRLVQQGGELQVNIGSLLGKFGEASKNLARRLIDDASVHFLATDAHSVKSRRPITRGDWQELQSILGEKLLARLCIDNPSALTEKP